jgi:hypothetical protein
MMTTESPKQPEVIFESPDKGNTVYARTIESTGRTLVHSEPLLHWRARWYEWEDILRAAEDNPALDDLIKKAEMVYELTK